MRANQRVVCAAYKMEDGLIITGARHYSPDMRATMLRIYGEGYHSKVDRKFFKGGFINQFGEYLTREEAWKIADKNGQIARPPHYADFDKPREAGIGDEGELYSENLY